MPDKEYRWRIYHIKGTPAQFLGTVSAPDEQEYQESNLGAGDQRGNFVCTAWIALCDLRGAG
jgi:hypothetical protein